MSLKDEIVPYVQGDGLVAPAKVNPPGTYRTCDNGPMFSSEYLIMLNRNNQLDQSSAIKYYGSIRACLSGDLQLHRAPTDTTPDEIDDYLGVLAGYAELNSSAPYRLPLRLYRFPQLLFAYLINEGFPAFVLFPLSIINALVLALSCINTIPGDADSRRLNWLLWQATKKKSILANLAGKFWHWRQTKVYKTQEVMKAVAAIYYEPGHPFAKYWID